MVLLRSKYGTYPQVIHAPDRDRNYLWPKLVSYFCERNEVVQRSDELTVVTWNNLEEGSFEKSLRLRAVPFFLTGAYDRPWSNYSKFRYDIEVAQKCGTEYLMGCDSHDVVLIGSPFEIVDRFKKMKCDLLFNCEKHFYPDFTEPVLQKWKLFEQEIGKGSYRFLNAGMWIGRTEFCVEFFRRADEVRVYDLFDCEKYQFLKRSSIGCDQSSLHHIFPEFHPHVQLDYGCEIFLNISFPEPDEVSFQIPLL